MVRTQKGLDQFFVDDELPIDKVSRSLFMTMDWCQIGWRAFCFLRNHSGSTWRASLTSLARRVCGFSLEV